MRVGYPANVQWLLVSLNKERRSPPRYSELSYGLRDIDLGGVWSRRPAIYLINNGVVEARLNYQSLEQDEIEKWFSKYSN